MHQSNEAAIFQPEIVAYFTVIFDAFILRGNPIPFGAALVTSGTDPRISPHFFEITTQSCVCLKIYLLKFSDLINKYLLIS